MAVLCFALRAFPLPHPEHRKPHNSSLPLPARSQRVPRLFINEKTEHPQDHHNRVSLSKLTSRGEIQGTRQRFTYILPPPQTKAACHWLHTGVQWHKVLFHSCKSQGSSPQWGGWPACPASGSGWPGARGCSPRRRQTGGSAAAPRPPSAAGQCPLPMTCRLPQQLNRLPQLLRAEKQHTVHFRQRGSHSGTSYLI